MKETTAMRLKELFQGTATILLIEDAQIMQEEIVRMFKKIAPAATVTVVTKSQYRHIDEIVDKNLYNLVLVGGRLGTWHHPVYRAFGPNLIPMLRKKHQHALIISTSNDPTIGEMSLEAGADDIISNMELSDLYKQYKI